jgi:hypothetical protein
VKFLDRLIRKREENGDKNFLKKTSKISCQLRKEVALLHPLRETTKSEKK